MRQFLKLWLLLGLLGLAAACGRSAPPPTPTVTPEATSTPVALPSPTPIPSATPTPTPVPPTATPPPSPTATPDLRVILSDPQTFLCRASDLPVQGAYYLAGSAAMSPLRNKEILQQWGADWGQRYLDETQRLDGWQVTYTLGREGLLLPREIRCQVDQYQTVTGAQTAFVKYNPAAFMPSDALVPFLRLVTPCDLGDACAYYRGLDLEADGAAYPLFVLEVQYRNVVFRVEGLGREEEVDLQVLRTVATNVLARLQQAELAPAP